ncbi:MAG: sulfite exporter TauE/SafE family protein [Bacteroidetes bacterium]|nr:sulfite exporter TauE/SafE family protein [Bacteroidota bacterium]
MDWVEWIVLPLVGAVGGFLAGMLGVGGGIIFVPLLTWLFNRMGLSNAEVVKYTLANSIFLVFISGVSGILKQRKIGTLNWQKALWIGIPGAIVSLIWSYFIQQGNWYKKESFQLVFLSFLVISIANMLMGNKKNATEEKEVSIPGFRPLELVVSMLAGSVVALSGLGGGVIMVPMFRMFLKMPMRSATALSLSIIPILSIAPLANYLSTVPHETAKVAHTGYISWPYALPIAIGVAIFAGIGLKTAKKIPVFYLRIIFAALSTSILIKTVYDIFHP